MNLDDFDELEEYETLEVEPELMEMEGTQYFFYALLVADALLLALVVIGVVIIVKM